MNLIQNKFYVLIVFSLIVSNSAFGQNENNFWYFGKYAALNFNSGAPVPVTTSAMTTWEGCASVSDKTSGALHFYTNGVTVWNKNNAVMQNGTGLWGDVSSTQSAHIVPWPGSDSLYYIFTTDAGTSGFPHQGKMCYSVVDMSLQGGNGAVIVKNVALFDTTTEKLTATLNKDGCAIWVLAHEWKSDAFYAYLVTDTGVSAPVISNSGAVHNCSYISHIKVSPDGKKLAVAVPCINSTNLVVELFDFDNATGLVSNPVSLPQDHTVYGLEFSPNSRFLYVIDHNNSSNILYKQIGQYDVTLGSGAAINASRIIVGAIYNATAFFNGAAQLAPDGKIYVVPTDADSLSVINYPDSAGLACNFVVAGLHLAGKLNDHGLPGRVVTANTNCNAVPSVNFASSDSVFCEKQCIDFFDLSTNNPTSWQWTFIGASPDTSSLQNPAGICYNNYGSFEVTLVACNAAGCDSITFQNFITEFQNPVDSIWQSNDTLYSLPAYSYQWYEATLGLITGAIDSFYVMQQPGSYYCVVHDSIGCEAVSNTITMTGLTPAFPMERGVIHPNPATDLITIDLPIIQNQKFLFEIFDTNGKIILIEFLDSKNKTININSISKGIYGYRILSEEKIISQGKFLKM